MDRPAHVAGQVLQADLCLGARDADAAHQGATPIIRLRTKHMLDAGANFRPRLVPLLLALAERPVAMRLAVDPAAQAPLGELLLRFRRAVGAVGPEVGGDVRLIQDGVQGLAVVHRCVRHFEGNYKLHSVYDTSDG